MGNDASTDFGLLIKETFQRFFKGENVVPLFVGFAVLMLLSVVTFGIAAPALFVGYSRIVLRVARGEATRFEELWSGFDRFGTALGAGVLMALAFLLGSVVVIGGVIAMFFFTFTFLVLADQRDLGAIDAMSVSATLVRHNLTDVLVAWVVTFVLSAVLSPTLIGSIFGGAFGALFTALVFARIRERAPTAAPTTSYAY